MRPLGIGLNTTLFTVFNHFGVVTVLLTGVTLVAVLSPGSTRYTSRSVRDATV